MKFSLRAVIGFALVFAVTVPGPSIARAQNPPAGALWDLSANFPGVLNTYTPFFTSFVGDITGTEYVSFAFIDVFGFFAFDDAQVNLSTGLINLLSDPSFESASDGQNCNHNNSLGCPPGWSVWIQPVDVSAIGQVATNSDPYGCDVNANSGTNFWCDPSLQGYDAVFQPIPTTLGSTYDISFWLEDDSGFAITNPMIDMLVYAGDSIPIGTVDITPEPFTFALTGLGLAVLGFRRRRAS